MFNLLAVSSTISARVNMKPSNAYKKIENCEYVIHLAKWLKISTVAIGGKDIFEGNKKLILAIVWQQMRYHIISILNQLRINNQQEVTEQSMIEWANKKLEQAGKKSRIQSFKDTTLKDSKFFIDFVDTIKPGSVEYDLVIDGQSTEDLMMNAKLAIGVARRIGCCIFLLWEDIVEVNPKMMLTFVGSLIFVAQGGTKLLESKSPTMGHPTQDEQKQPQQRTLLRKTSSLRFERQPNQ